MTRKKDGQGKQERVEGMRKNKGEKEGERNAIKRQREKNDGRTLGSMPFEDFFLIHHSFLTS